MITSVKIEGLESLRKAFEKCENGMFDAIVEAAQKGAKIQHETIGKNIPVKTGELKAGLGSEIKLSKSKRTVIIDTGIINNPTGRDDFFDKAASVEYGHVGPGGRSKSHKKQDASKKVAPAIPYMRNSLDITKTPVRNQIKADLAKAVEKLVSGNGNI